MSQFSSEIAQNGTALPHLIEWRGGFGDATVLNRISAQHSVYYDVPASKLYNKDAKAAKDGPITCDLMARRIGSKFLGVVEIHDANGARVADVAGTGGAGLVDKEIEHGAPH